ncbi:MAG TPA: amidohydrolase family protein [Candidatus Acidoferrales bacterium]|jgi:imidazolonepropionase-like amidohydrolase|nr:amidohydrolase family protein [Candidatus Acidoferrales bacterium]
MRTGRRWIFVFLCVACAWALAHAAAGRAEGGEPRYFAIKGARIVPVSGPAIENGTVVVANGLIQAVGADVPIPAEAWVIDGKGLVVYPGLIDAGTDLGFPADANKSAPGSRSGPPAMGPEDRPATMPWRAAEDLKPDDKRIESWREAGFTSALTTPKGGIFPGQGTVIDLAGERAGEMVVKSPATLAVAFQTMPNFFEYPDSLMGVIAYVRQVLLDAEWYAQAQQIYEHHPRGLERPAYDRTERVVARVLRDQEIVLLPANMENQIRRGLRLAQEWNLHAALYGGQQGYAVADALAAKKMPVLVSLKWPEKEKDADPDAEQPLRDLRFRDRAPGTPAAFAKAGVKFAFYSDGIAEPKDIMKNVKKAMDAGLAADAALRAFTLDAAEILGVSDRLGSIEAGKIANLIVLDGELFNEKTKVKDVFVDGQRFEIHEAPPEEKPGEKPKDKPGDTKALLSAVEGGAR